MQKNFFAQISSKKAILKKNKGACIYGCMLYVILTSFFRSFGIS